MYNAPIVASMIGGITVNVSGPCFRQNDVVKAVFDEYAVDCIKVIVLIYFKCLNMTERKYRGKNE